MSRVEHPTIVINGQLTTEKEPALRLGSRYADAILKAGGVPLVVPPVGGPSDVRRLLERADGLLLTGGDDFDTERLGLGPMHSAADPVPTEKQDFDVVLVRAALDLDMPVLGICYGMQLMGLEGGAAFHQHLPDDPPGALEHRSNVHHDVRVRADSKLARLIGVEPVSVISRHHQALASVEPPWTVVARSPDGLIEAIERPDLSFALGVQWHPELAPEGSPHDKLFRGFVGAAGMAAGQREYSHHTSP